MEQTIHTTLFPDGTTVAAYRSRGYSNFPASGPPGSAVAEAVSAGGAVTFSGLTEDEPYFAAAKVNGEWQSVHFIPQGPPSMAVETRSLSSHVLEVPERDEKLDVASQAELDAKTLLSLADVDVPEPKTGDTFVYFGGKWIRRPGARFTPEMFGAKGDSNGSAGSGTDDSKPVQEAATAAATSGGEFYCEKFYRTTKTIKVVTDTFFGNGIGTGKCGIITDTSEYDAFVVGPGAEGSGTRASGYVRNFDIGGGNCAVKTAGAAKVTGNAAFKLNGLRNFEVSIRVKGAHDIAFDSENNCYGTTYNMARVEYDAVRVGINYRKGAAPGNGEDQLILNSWISGEVAALHITSGKNYKAIGGQLSASRQASAEEDGRGIVILGKDYLGLEGAEDTAVTLWTSFESCQRCWTIRAFKRVNITAHSFFNAGTDTAAALGFYKNSAHGNSVIRLDGCGFGGSEFSKPASEIVIREGSSSGSTWEERGSWGSYKDGTGETDALWSNMARRAEIPRAAGSRDGNIFYFQGMEFKVTSGVLEFSELHKESWRVLSPKRQVIASAEKITITGGTTQIELTGTAEVKEIAGGLTGQSLVVIFTSTAKLVKGSTLKLAATISGTADDVAILTFNGTNWYQAAPVSVN